MKKLMRKKSIKEYGAGYAISGGSYGNPHQVGTGIGRGIGHRGMGFGSGSTSGGPNLMYTYSVKPLNHSLEPQLVGKEEEEAIGPGSKIIGRVLNKFVKDKKGKIKPKTIEGTIEKVIKDAENNILYYTMIDPKTKERIKIEPTSVQLVKYETTRLEPMVIDNRLAAQMESFKLVSESLNEANDKGRDLLRKTDEIRVPILNLTWEKVQPLKRRYVKLPHDFMSSNMVYAEVQYDEWYKKFIDQYGTEGDLVGKPTKSGDLRWYVEGNDKWDQADKTKKGS